MNDDFYDLPKPNLKKVKEILLWSQKNALKFFVDELEVAKSLSRSTSDKSFEDILNLLEKKSINFFRVILRKQFNGFGIISDKSGNMDVIEIAIRNITDGKKEYFIFAYIDKNKLDYLIKKYNLQRLN